MANQQNPFLTDSIEKQLEIATKSYEHDKELPIERVSSEPEGASLDEVASKLLKDNLHLAALELHTELLEAGRELPRLRDFFSNPANFERTSGTEYLGSPGLSKSV